MIGSVANEPGWLLSHLRAERRVQEAGAAAANSGLAMIILGVYESHDAGAALYDDYRLIAAVAQERVTRIKGDGLRFPAEAVAECLAQAGLDSERIEAVAMSRGYYPDAYFTARSRWPAPVPRGEDRHLLKAMTRQWIRDPARAFDARRFLADHGLHPNRIKFYNHHFAHALAALFHTDYDDALIYTSDGGGDRVFYSARRLVGGRLRELFGGEAHSRGFRPTNDADSLGQLYAVATEVLGFRRLRHEGKVLGLAAFGEPIHAPALSRHYRVRNDGQIRAGVRLRKIHEVLRELAASARREDIAASVQQVLEQVTIASLDRIFERERPRNLALSGGVFANVKLTQRIAERFPFDEVFVYPAMSDQGEAAGGVLQCLLERDGLATFLARREKFGNLYFGRDYMAGADEAFLRAGATRLASQDIVETAARMLAERRILGLYLGRCEYGPRALGARTIMASPADRSINDWLNKRLERTEFMPFAPVARDARVAEIFDLPSSLHYTARYMTVTCNVKPEWRDRIPAVVHVDGTARPQVIRREDNPTYYDILRRFEEISGLPCAINTSFNAHEEPIINRPEEALRALEQGRVDLLVTETGIFAKGPSGATESDENSPREFAGAGRS
jgi:carbamoyltransferase